METNQVKRHQDEAIEIDLGQLFRELLSNIVAIVLTALIGAMIGYLAGKTVITPEYTSTTKIYVTANDETQQSNSVNTGELQAGALLTKDYEQIIESREVTETVIARLELKSGDEAMSHSTLLGKISVTIPSDTRVVSISVTDSDPYMACDIANAVRDVAMERIQSVMDMKSVKIVEEANVPTSPSSTSASRVAMMGGVVGLVLAIAVCVILFLRNNTITTAEDVERYLGLSTLGTIPISAETGKKGKKKRKSRK